MIIAWMFAALLSAVVMPGGANAGARFLANPKLGTDCQSALIAASTSFATQKLKQLDKCAMTTLKCIQTVAPNDQAENDPIEVCLEKALVKCDKATETILAEEQALSDAITMHCSALDADELMRADGVGFEAIAQDCLDVAGVTLSDLASVAECVVAEHECAVERMYLMAHPRAGELFDLVGADLGGDSCLDDLGGPGEGPGDLSLGRRLTQCQQGVTKASASFVASKLKSTGQCLNDLFQCVQLKPGDQGCLAKAQSCDKAFAQVTTSGIKFVPAVNKSCEAIDFPDLTVETGIDYDAVVEGELCVPFGISGIGTVNHYANCLYRSNECDGEEILKFSVPRAAEILGLVNRTLPGRFFCIPPDEGF